MTHIALCVFCLAVDEAHLSLPHQETPSGEEIPPQLEEEAASAMRPSLISGYSKQFQKSLPPRFLRQQVKVITHLVFNDPTLNQRIYGELIVNLFLCWKKLTALFFFL